MRRCRRDAGTVTAETAMVLPVLLVVTWVVLAMIKLGAAQLACQDAARAAARAASRGEPSAVVLETARRAAPEGAVLQVERDGDLVVVVVSARPRFAGPLALAGPTVHGRAVAAAESSTAYPP